jgi:hypothetical protein
VIIDTQKVIVLPRKIALQDQVTYLCNCDRCLARQEQNFIETQQKVDAIKHIQEMLLMTPLVNKNIQLSLNVKKIAYSSMSNEDFLGEIDDELRQVRFLALAVKGLEKFIIQFNKKYRHPLICELHDNTVNLMDNLPNLNAHSDYDYQLERINALLIYSLDQMQLIQKIQQEKFILEEPVIMLKEKFKKAKGQLASISTKVMHKKYQHQSENYDN